MSSSPAHLTPPPSQLSLLMNPLPGPPDKNNHMISPEIYKEEPGFFNPASSQTNATTLICKKISALEKKAPSPSMAPLCKPCLIPKDHTNVSIASRQATRPTNVKKTQPESSAEEKTYHKTSQTPPMHRPSKGAYSALMKIYELMETQTNMTISIDTPALANNALFDKQKYN
ncbi:hypothetical protein O181_062523 [Austropuccinia psidii MF-1]|uniref:Uncharacterized protein n=1 Tax=Austropuccinia psidii MF-1 TaxID=1389203 RepID=A0A9Q3EPW5_9BASI|nr:hypothetical protein [Austropuccinia psidii MF-1]